MRCINFVLFQPELIEEGLEQGVNPRSMVNFFNMIRGIKDFASADGLTKIQLLGEASIGKYAAQMFVQFINNKLDKLISPEEMLFNPNDKAIMENMKGTIGTGNSYRADVAYVLSSRLINRSISHAENNPIDDKLCDRLEMMVTGKVFSVDVCYNIVRTIHAANTQKFRKLSVRPTVMKYLTSS